MSSFFKFASVAYPEKYGYAFDSSAWGKASDTHYYFRQFETYGDGLTQHSNDWSVSFDFLADYLASLAVAMMGNDELVKAAGYSLGYAPGLDRIAFAASVVWKDSDDQYDKRRFYSMELLKMGSRSKQYDKRYQQIGKCEDGSRSSIFRLLCNEYARGFERFQIAEAITEWTKTQSKHVEYGEGWPEFLNGDMGKLYDLRRALQACRYLCESVRLREAAQCYIDNHARLLAMDRANKSSDVAAD